MRDNKYLTKIVASLLLGDGSITKDKRDNGNCCFEHSQIADHLDYLEYIKNILSEITTVSLLKSKEARDVTFPNGITSACKEQWRIRTNRHPFFNSFRERMYGTGVKTIDHHYFSLFDWETLAIWYMDDGYISSPITKKDDGRQYKHSRLGICSQGFSQSENFILKKFLKETFNLEFNLSQNKYPSGIKYRLLLREKDIPVFLTGISKYILPSFEYKLNYHYEILERVTPEINQDEDIV